VSFTYNFMTKRDVARVRLALGDTVADSGVLPEGKNFSDEEIEAVLNDCDGDINAATYVLLKALSNAWGTYVDITVGPRKEALSDISFHYARRAQEMGQATGLSAKAFSVTLKRVDGYTDDK